MALPPKARSGDRQRLLNDDVEKLVVEARRVGVGLEEVLDSVETQWKKLDSLKVVSNDH